MVDASVQPSFRSDAELRDYLAPEFRSRAFPSVEKVWYQAPGGDYHPDLWGEDGVRPGADADVTARFLFETIGADSAILNPLTRGNLPDYILNSAICAATNRWLAERWLEGDAGTTFYGTIRVNPEDVGGAVAEIERWADHPRMVQIGVPLQSREPFGKPQFLPIWEAAATHGLPVAVHVTGGAGIEYPPTPSGHPRTYPHYAAFMPLNYFYHLSTMLVEGTFDKLEDLKFVFADGGADLLTPLIWRMDTFWRSFRDQTPWMTRYPSESLREHVRFCTNRLEGPVEESMVSPWMRQLNKGALLMFASHYPHWSLASPADLPAGLDGDDREGILWRNASDLYGLSERSS